MDIEEKIEITKPEGYNCFACGTANPIGLNLQFYYSGEKVCTEIVLGKNHIGWSNIVHGGIISTILDEVMSWTILYFKRIFFLTRKIKFKYIRPVLIGTPLVIKGEILAEGHPSNLIRAKAEIRDDKGILLVKSTGEFITIEKEDFPPAFAESKNEIFSFIEKLPSK